MNGKDKRVTLTEREAREAKKAHREAAAWRTVARGAVLVLRGLAVAYVLDSLDDNGDAL